MTSALNRELAGNIDQLIKVRGFLAFKQNANVDISKVVDFFIRDDCYKEALKKPLTFNSLKSANHLNALYSAISLFKSHYGREERTELIASCDAILESFRSRVKSGVFSGDEFEDVGNLVEYFYPSVSPPPTPPQP